jgi:hypothetical protein
MKLTMLLADAAQAVGGKLYILGGGWSVAGPGPVPMALAIKIDVPWEQANTSHRLRVILVDEDEQSVRVPTPTGELPFEIESTFEAGRPAGIKPGTPLDLALALNMPAIPLRAGTRYIWRCFIDETTEETWQVSFLIRDAPAPQR